MYAGSFPPWPNLQIDYISKFRARADFHVPRCWGLFALYQYSNAQSQGPGNHAGPTDAKAVSPRMTVETPSVLDIVYYHNQILARLYPYAKCPL